MREGEFTAKNGARVTVRRAETCDDETPQRKRALDALARTLLAREFRGPKNTA